MKINISNLSQGTHDYELSKSATDLGLEENFLGDVAAKVEIEKSSRQMLLSIEATSHGVFQCDRCLEEFRRPIEPRFQTLYVWDHAERSDDDADDVRVLTADMNIIDLSADVRDAIVLAVPLKLLCKDECAGLCQRCGKNLNHAANGRCDCVPRDVDPRWNKLAGISEVSIVSKKN